MPLEPKVIYHQSEEITFADQLTISNQIINAAINIDEAFCLLGMLILPSLHQASDILREECRLNRIDHVEQVLSVDGGLDMPLSIFQVRQVHLK